MSLLEKYDNKLDEMQDDIELKDIKMIELEREQNDSKMEQEMKNNGDSLEDKIKFLVEMLQKLRGLNKDPD